MITFKRHTEVSKALSNEEALQAHLEKLDPVERLKFLRDVKGTYPLEVEDEVSDFIKENYNYYDNVFDLVLGQFIMVEQILTGKFKFADENMMDLELMTYILRPKGEEKYDNTDPKVESKHREAILNTPVQDLYSVVNRFLKNREQVLFKQFSGVFYSVPDEEEDDNEFSSPSPQELFNQQWYWYSIVRTLAKEDVRMYDEIYMLKMNVVLPEMSYMAQRNKIEAAQMRQQKALSRL